MPASCIASKALFLKNKYLKMYSSLTEINQNKYLLKEMVIIWGWTVCNKTKQDNTELIFVNMVLKFT